MFVSIIGSKKCAILPTILLLVDGILMLMTSYASFLRGLKSFLSSVIPFGRPINITIILDVSLNMLTRIIMLIVSTKDFSKHIGIRNISIAILTICSTMFETM